MKLLYSSLLLVCSLFATSCKCDHFVEEPAPFKVGWVVCTDGEIMPYCEFIKSDKIPTAIVYWVNPDYTADISGYAVYLNDLPDAAFSETELETQGTSADIRALDGNENTWILHSNTDIKSPLAQNVFDLWTYGQSAYIPSVGQLAQIYAVKDFINPRIEGIGGDPLADAADYCWYWSSTEVAGQEPGKAWLYSMHWGTIHETPKLQEHRARPVITLYR